MAGKKKKGKIHIKLVSTAKTGYYIVRTKNPKKLTRKLSFSKYDPVIRKHVEFKEEKLSN